MIRPEWANHLPSFNLFIEGRAARAFCQFKQKAGSLWMQECDMTAACTDTPFLVDERNFFSLQICEACFDVVNTKSNMLEAVLPAVGFFNETSDRAIRSCGTQEFEFASFGLRGWFEEACCYMLIFNGLIRQGWIQSQNVFHLLFNKSQVFNSYAYMIDTQNFECHNNSSFINYLNILPTMESTTVNGSVFLSNTSST